MAEANGLARHRAVATVAGEVMPGCGCADCGVGMAQWGRERGDINGWAFDLEGDRLWCGDCAPVGQRPKDERGEDEG